MEVPSGETEIEGISKQAKILITASTMFPGFRFSPTDVELISFYLQKKVEGSDKRVEVISEVDMYGYEPWDLPAKSVIQSDNEWFFFSPRGRKYANGLQSKRTTELGYWKATGKGRNIKSGPNMIGTKRTLVFHKGRAPKGERTEWIMHEYCMNEISQDTLVVCQLRKNSGFHLKDSSTRASSRKRNLLTLPSSNRAVSKVGIEELGLSKEGEAVGGSHDSYSNNQTDLTSEYDQKLTNMAAMAETSSLKKGTGIEEDLYAEILKDDIIKLDESSSSVTPRPVPVMTRAEGVAQQPIREIAARGLPLQGRANRRIKLRMKKARVFPADASKLLETGEDENPNQEQPPKCLLGRFSLRTSNHRRASLLFVIFTSLALFVSFLGGSLCKLEG
ncbi:NAC domain-containing protein 89-like [Juglans microcarpa x Juglans regia]|uniref:NAC domain-containing protein 89-like n=1 Tax=Juglans microcarpa x Juglans regia TaxID=2249226 RepID=UPI001B7DCFF0|nr:NAC domain-containing protein 89-like [Juglans microcarpa x Juglans regia]